jgi:hypothetical protein
MISHPPFDGLPEQSGKPSKLFNQSAATKTATSSFMPGPMVDASDTFLM